MNADDQKRLEAWLDGARTCDLSDLEQLAPTTQAERRAVQVHNLARVIRNAPVQQVEHKRSRRTLYTAIGSLAAAAALALGAGMSGLHPWAEAEVVVVADSATLHQVVGKVMATGPNGVNGIVTPDTLVHAGDEISTAAQAFASLETGRARVDLSGATTLRVDRAKQLDQIYHLQAGRVDVSVPKLPGEKRSLKVTTSDAVVSVHGTAFSVEVVQNDGRSLTRVEVTRGLVSVDSAGQRAMLRPGDRWSSDAPSELQKTAKQVADESGQPPVKDEAQAAEAPTAPARLHKPVGSRHSSASKPVARAEQPSSASEADVDPSDLAEQNRLFAQAMTARDRGDDHTTVSRLRQLLRRFPASPLRSTAKAELTAAKNRLAE